ncbi:MAG: DUF2293 domain-containing protein [Fimbriimonas sp.]
MTQKGKPVEKDDEIVVFSLYKPATCSECGAKLDKGDLAQFDREKALCLGCAELDHLVFLPRGDVALTRRSRKYSSLAAVVLEGKRRRNRHERLGLLAEADAIARAEDECAGDSEERAAARAKAAVVRERQDREYVAQFTELVRRQYPKCPADEARTIAEHACEKYSGRVGRSASAKEFDPDKITLAVRAHVRHVHTDYDALLVGGVDRADARARIARRLDAVVDGWR